MKPKVLFFLFLAFLLLLKSACGATVSSGTATLNGTYCFNFDSGTQSATGLPAATGQSCPGFDVWWETESPMPNMQAQMVPQGTATIVNLGAVNFSSVTLAYLQSLTYGTTPIDGNNDNTNLLVTGDVFAVHINGGNYAKVLVTSYGYNLGIQWVTMSTPPPVSFASAVNYTVGNLPDSVAVGDFNGDGNLDLGVANGGSDTVSVLLGDGKGNFTLAASPSTGPGGGDPYALAAGNFNGYLGLAVANLNFGTVGVLLGDGSGKNFTLSTLSTPSRSDEPYAVAVGNFGNGYQDLAVADYMGNTLSIFLGDGQGDFTLTSSPSTGSGPVSIGIGDFTGNGILDLAVPCIAMDYVDIFLGDGKGNFTLTSSQPSTGAVPTSVAVGDFNGDGILDLAVANRDDNTVSILLGDGTGNFTLVSSPSTGTAPLSVAVGDFNHDGQLDLVTANYNSGNVSVLLGNGDGTFQPAVNYAVGSAPMSVAVGDFNGDGKPDLAVANGPNNTTVSVLLNTTGSMNPGSPAYLSQQFVINSTPSNYIEFDFDDITAYHAGTITVQPDTVATVSASGVTQANYANMVAGTSLATTTCYIAPGEGTDSSGNPLCAEITLTCTNASNSTPAGDNCPQSSARNLFFANKLETSTPIGGTTSSIPAGTAPTLAMGSDAWSPSSSCTLTGPEANELCPHSVLTHLEQYSTEPGIKSGGTSPTSNSTYIAGCCEPEWSTAATIPMWTNNTTVPLSFTTSPPTAPPSPNNNWVAAPNQSITWGVEPLGATPDPTYPIPGDQTVNNTACPPPPWPSPGTTPSDFTASGTVTVPGEGLYEVHYFSTACDNQEELLFTLQTGTTNWASFKTVTFGVDTTNPTVTTPVLSNNNPHFLDPTVTASFTCTDPTINALGATVVASGLAGCGSQVTPSPGSGPAGPTAPTPGSSSQTVSSFPVPTSATGPQTLTVYGTDLAGNTTSASVGYTVLPASTVTTVSTPGSSAPGVAYTASVTVTPQFSGTPTGSVTVSDDTGAACSTAITLSGGRGSCLLTSTLTGTRTITANYSGDANFAASSGTTTLTVLGPLASVSPSSINFGTVYLATITVKSVTVKNVGNLPMTISTPFFSILSSGDPSEFVVVNLCPKSLAAGSSCTIYVSFIAGPFYTPQTATLSVADSAFNSPQLVALTATVINPQAWLSAWSLSFGTVKVGTSSAAKAVTLKNTGATALTINGITIAGNNSADFSLFPPSTCPISPAGTLPAATLRAGSSCTISVTFTPRATGSRSASVVITDNALISPQKISLSGTGD